MQKEKVGVKVERAAFILIVSGAWDWDREHVKGVVEVKRTIRSPWLIYICFKKITSVHR